MSRELRALAELRRRGRAPELPVFVTDMQRFQRNMDGVGALVIWTDLNTVRDWTPLIGLEVYVMLRNGYSDAGARLIEAVRACEPRLLWIWDGEHFELVGRPKDYFDRLEDSACLCFRRS